MSARNLWLGDNIKQAVDAKRIHHQLLPDQLVVEEGVSEVGSVLIIIIFKCTYDHVLLIASYLPFRAIKCVSNFKQAIDLCSFNDCDVIKSDIECETCHLMK